MGDLLHLVSRKDLLQYLRGGVDILLVAFVVYRILLVIRGTRAERMGLGVFVLVGVYMGAKYAGLVTLLSFMNTILANIVIVVVVVFQNDIRRALMRVGDRAWLPTLSREGEGRVVDEVVAAATELARHRTGALIAFEQEANLDEFVSDTGTPLDAAVSRELLVTLFQPEAANKLHDGAVVLRNLRIASAGVFFPMPEQRDVDTSLGSRHRAAFGITEETDAVVVAVSEERGTISVFYNGNIIQNLDGNRLRTVLRELLGHKAKLPSQAKIPVTDNKRTGSSEGGPTSKVPPSMIPPSMVPPSRLPIPSQPPRSALILPKQPESTPVSATGSSGVSSGAPLTPSTPMTPSSSSGENVPSTRRTVGIDKSLETAASKPAT